MMRSQKLIRRPFHIPMNSEFHIVLFYKLCLQTLKEGAAHVQQVVIINSDRKHSRNLL